MSPLQLNAQTPDMELQNFVFALFGRVQPCVGPGFPGCAPISYSIFYAIVCWKYIICLLTLKKKKKKTVKRSLSERLWVFEQC